MYMYIATSMLSVFEECFWNFKFLNWVGGGGGYEGGKVSAYVRHIVALASPEDTLPDISLCACIPPDSFLDRRWDSAPQGYKLQK